MKTVKATKSEWIRSGPGWGRWEGRCEKVGRKKGGLKVSEGWKVGRSEDGRKKGGGLKV